MSTPSQGPSALAAGNPHSPLSVLVLASSPEEVARLRDKIDDDIKSLEAMLLARRHERTACDSWLKRAAPAPAQVQSRDGASDVATRENELRRGRFTIDRRTGVLSVGRRRLKFSPRTKQFRVLALTFDRSGRTQTYEDLAWCIWNEDLRRAQGTDFALRASIRQSFLRHVKRKLKLAGGDFKALGEGISTNDEGVRLDVPG